MNLSSLRKKLAEAAPVAQPQQKPQSQQQVMPDRLLAMKTGVNYTNLIMAMRAMSRMNQPNPARLNPQQRDAYNKYMSASVGAASVAARSGGSKYFAEGAQMDPPMILVLKRRGIRIFPDGKRVALYKNDKLNLSFSVPYNSNGPEQELVGISEEIEQIMKAVYDSLSEENQIVFLEMFETKEGFDRAVDFSLSVAEKLLEQEED